LGEKDGQTEETLQSLDHYWQELSSYDMIDQAELVAARIRLERSRGTAWPEGERKMQSLLLQLPPAVENQLGRLGY
jgi:hypothetical protein